MGLCALSATQTPKSLLSVLDRNWNLLADAARSDLDDWNLIIGDGKQLIRPVAASWMRGGGCVHGSSYKLKSWVCVFTNMRRVHSKRRRLDVSETSARSADVSLTSLPQQLPIRPFIKGSASVTKLSCCVNLQIFGEI